VNSDGLFCSIVLLFGMLLLLLIMIAAFKWRMNKTMGGLCLGLYFCFLAASLLLEYDVIPCFNTSNP
jgi:Ca2+/Na+ antiporter